MHSSRWAPYISWPSAFLSPKTRRSTPGFTSARAAIFRSGPSPPNTSLASTPTRQTRFACSWRMTRRREPRSWPIWSAPMTLPVTATKATKSVHPRLGTGRGIGRCHERSLAGPYPSLGFLPRLGPSRHVRAALFAARRSDASRLASDAQNRRCTHVAEKESQARAAIRFQSRAGGVGARSGADDRRAGLLSQDAIRAGKRGRGL